MNVAFPLASGLLIPCTSAFALWMTLRRKSSGKSVKSRSFIFYRAMSGFMLGEAVATGTSGWVYSACVLGMIFLCFVVDQIGRYWNTNRSVIAREGITEEAEFAVDDFNGEQKRFLEMRNDTLHDDVYTEEHGTKDNRRRHWFVAAQILAMAFLLVAVPLRVEQTVGTFFCFLLLTLCGCLAVCGGMIHIHLHVHRWVWAAITVFWMCVVVIGQVMPTIIMGNTWSLFLPWVGIPAGTLYYLFMYYWKSHDADRISWKQQVVGAIVLAVAMGQAPLTRYFLIAP